MLQPTPARSLLCLSRLLLSPFDPTPSPVFASTYPHSAQIAAQLPLYLPFLLFARPSSADLWRWMGHRTFCEVCERGNCDYLLLLLLLLFIFLLYYYRFSFFSSSFLFPLNLTFLFFSFLFFFVFPPLIVPL